MLLEAIQFNFAELSEMLQQLSKAQYNNACAEIGNATIGQHLRHIIGMFQVLADGYDSGVIDYDKRERNLLLQTDPHYALHIIAELEPKLARANKPMELLQITNGFAFKIPTNYSRELLYNLEHSIHHQALIKVALRNFPALVSENFGVARSTIEFRKQCAQ